MGKQTFVEPVVSPFVDGRFCGHCGGETHHARRLENRELVTYLLCRFCGRGQRMMSCNIDTWEYSDLAAEATMQKYAAAYPDEGRRQWIRRRFSSWFAARERG